MKKQLLFSLFCFLSLSTWATDYYLAENGNDSNNGTSQATPWKTIAKLNTFLGGFPGPGIITNGDRVLFRRGDTFRGQVDILAYNNNGIYFGAYGTGNIPVLKGSVAVSGWTVHSGDIWKASVAQTVHFLFLDNTVQTLSRFPNVGYLYAGSTSNSSVTSSSIGSSGLNFIGANICMREYDWRLNRQVISSQSGNTVNYSSMSTSPGVGRNYYFDNSLALLDTAGEWFYNTTTKVLYFKVKSGVNPNNLNIEASINDFGLGGNNNHLNTTVENINFQHYAQNAINLLGTSDNAIIQNCTFNNNFQGILLGGSNELIQNNSFSNSFSTGVEFGVFGNSYLKNNKIVRTGINFGVNRPSFTGAFHPHAVLISNGAAGGTVSENIIDQTGYNGIKFLGTGLIIEKNQISNTMLNMNDGGAIYTWGTSSHNCVVRDNFIRNVVGNIDGVTLNGFITYGIYLDNYSYSNTVVNNTVADIPSGGGILVNAGSYNNIIRSNVTYNCGMIFSDFWNQSEAITGNRVARNIFYSLNKELRPIRYVSVQNRWNFATLDSNYYCNPYSPYVASRSDFTNIPNYTLPNWQSLNSGQDVNSKASYLQLLENPVSGSPGAEMITNGTFDSNINSWVCFASSGSCNSTWDNTAGFSTGAIKTTTNLPSGAFTYVISPNFSTTNEQWYNIKFKAKASTNLDLSLQLKRSYGDYAVLQYAALVPVNTDIQSYDITFKANITESIANMSFQIIVSGQTCWLDDVSIKPVNVSTPNPKLISVLFSNPTNSVSIIPLNGTFKNLDNQVVSSISLQPWSSQILTNVGVVKIVKEKYSLLNPISNLGSLGEGILQTLAILPNPIDDFLSFILPNTSETYQVNITNSTGQSVYAIQSYSGEAEAINLQHLPPGIYFAELVSSKIRWVKKISLE